MVAMHELGYSGVPVGKMFEFPQSELAAYNIILSHVTSYFYISLCFCRQGVSGASHAMQRMNILHLAELLSMAEPLI